jgi:hypothetical protein
LKIGFQINFAVSTVTWLPVGESGVRIPTGEENFLFSETSKPPVGTPETLIEWEPLFVPGVKAVVAWN